MEKDLLTGIIAAALSSGPLGVLLTLLFTRRKTAAETRKASLDGAAAFIDSVGEYGVSLIQEVVEARQREREAIRRAREVESFILERGSEETRRRFLLEYRRA